VLELMGPYYSLGLAHRCVPNLDIDNANIIMHGITNFKVFTCMGATIGILFGLVEQVIPPCKNLSQGQI
jgi:hypothetical protein